MEERHSGKGYRPPAAAPGAMVQWPDSFGTRFTVFVDTEEEFDWGGPFSRESGGTSHMAMGVMLRAAGADARNLKTVVFKGGGEVTTALLGGHVDMAFAPTQTALPLIQSGMGA